MELKTALAVVSYGFNAVLALAAVLIVFIDFPLKETKPPRLLSLSGFIPFAANAAQLLLTCLLGSAAFELWLRGTFGPDDWRFTGVVVAVVYLVSKIVSDIEEPVVRSLTIIRRDLAFGRIDPATAVAQADIAIYGMRFSDFFQNDIAAFLATLEAARAEISAIGDAAEGLMQAVPASGRYTDAQLALIASVRASNAARLKNLEKLTEELENAKIFRRAFGSAIRDEEIGAKLRAEVTSFKLQVKTAADRINQTNAAYPENGQVARV
jgi:hypothetical protein